VQLSWQSVENHKDKLRIANVSSKQDIIASQANSYSDLSLFSSSPLPTCKEKRSFLSIWYQFERLDRKFISECIGILVYIMTRCQYSCSSCSQKRNGNG